jgi:HEPN domain-containing protein
MSLSDEFVAKAEVDFRSALHLTSARDPVPDAVCFHCQQCAEKYLKAFLESRGVMAPRTHDLDNLLSLCEAHAPTLSSLSADVMLLDPYGVDFRYPGASAGPADAEAAVIAMTTIRTGIRRALGLAP